MQIDSFVQRAVFTWVILPLLFLMNRKVFGWIIVLSVVLYYEYLAAMSDWGSCVEEAGLGDWDG